MRPRYPALAIYQVTRKAASIDRPTAREDTPGKSLKNVTELLLTYTHGWNRTESEGGNEWIINCLKLYKQLCVRIIFLETLAEGCPILEAHVLKFGYSQKLLPQPLMNGELEPFVYKIEISIKSTD